MRIMHLSIAVERKCPYACVGAGRGTPHEIQLHVVLCKGRGAIMALENVRTRQSQCVSAYSVLEVWYPPNQREP